MQRLTGSSNIRQLRDKTRCTRPPAAPVRATRSSHLEDPRSCSLLGADRKHLRDRLPRKPLPLRRKATPSRQNAGVIGRDRYLAIGESSCSAPNANQRCCDLDLLSCIRATVLWDRLAESVEVRTIVLHGRLRTWPKPNSAALNWSAQAGLQKHELHQMTRGIVERISQIFVISCKRCRKGVKSTPPFTSSKV
jgi:hypothetical protein